MLCLNKTVWGPDNLFLFANAYQQNHIESVFAEYRCERLKANNDDLYIKPLSLDLKVQKEEFKGFNEILECVLVQLQKFVNETLNKDEECLKAQAIYASVYNLLMTMVINFRDLSQGVCDLINSMIEAYDESPFDNHFMGLYLFE